MKRETEYSYKHTFTQRRDDCVRLTPTVNQLKMMKTYYKMIREIEKEREREMELH